MAWIRGLRDAVLPGRKVLVDGHAHATASHRTYRNLAKLGWVLLTFVILGVGLAQASTYVYDANGRLRAITKSTGYSVEYIYDAMGNLLSVSAPTNQLKIFAFTPSHGAVGVPVTVYGQGFSTTPGNDVLKFNGTAATVLTATATVLTTTVPVGATTGKITVRVGAGAPVVSDDVFTVDNTGLAPVVTSFTPVIGAIGTAVTVTGQHFNPVANQTIAAINGWKTIPTSVTDTQVQFAVLENVGSGKVSVTTPFGTGSSAADFYVTPPGISAADVVVQTRMAVGDSLPLNNVPAGKYAAVLFDATPGAWLSFQVSNLNTTASYTVYDSRNRSIAAGTLSATTLSIHLPELMAPGTYSIWIKPNTASASMTLALQADPSLQPNTPLTISTASGQTERVVFVAAKAQTVALQVNSVITVPSGQYVDYTVYTPSGDQYVIKGTGSATLWNLPNLPITGDYPIIIRPDGTAAAGTTITTQMTLIPGLTAVLVADGDSKTLSTTVPLLNAYLSFTANAGDNLGLGISGLSISNGNYATVDIYDSNNNLVVAASCFVSNDGCGLSMQNLAYGNYQAVVNAGYAPWGFTATLSHDAVGTLPFNTATSINILRRGQAGSYTFNAASAQTYALALGAPTTSPSGEGVSYTLYSPDGSKYGSQSANGGTALTWNLPSLSQGGLYRLYVVPSVGATLTESAEFASGVTGELTVDGSTENFDTTIPGENIYLNFTANGGDNLGFGVDNLGLSSGNQAAVSVYDMDGNFIASNSSCSTIYKGCGLDLQNLSANGYQIIVTPPANSTMSFTAMLSHDVAGVLQSGVPTAVNLARRGQTAIYTFSNATVGQSLQIESSNQEMVPNSFVNYVLSAPNGGGVNTPVNFNIAPIWDIPNLSLVGTYKIYIQPGNGATLSEVLELGPLVAAPLPIDGTAQNLAASAPGESFYLTFTTTSKKNIEFVLSNSLESPDNNFIIMLYGNGFYQESNCYVPQCVMWANGLSAGDYEMIVLPHGNNDTMSFTISASQQ